MRGWGFIGRKAGGQLWLVADTAVIAATSTAHTSVAIGGPLPAAELRVTAAVRAVHRRVRRGWLAGVLNLAERFNCEGPL